MVKVTLELEIGDSHDVNPVIVGLHEWCQNNDSRIVSVEQDPPVCPVCGGEMQRIEELQAHVCHHEETEPVGPG